MKTFLTDYLKDEMDLSPVELTERINEAESVFKDTCEFIYTQLGEKPFQIRNRFNYAILDSVFCTCIQAMQMGITDVNERFARLKQDAEFVECVTANTSDQSTVTKRFAKARHYLLDD